MIIAIDGPAGAGKSTIARALAARLGFAFLDTGALYRCAVLAGLRRDAVPEDIVAGLNIELGERVLLDGEDVTVAIRSPEISERRPRLPPALRFARRCREAARADVPRGLGGRGPRHRHGRRARGRAEDVPHGREARAERRAREHELDARRCVARCSPRQDGQRARARTAARRAGRDRARHDADDVGRCRGGGAGARPVPYTLAPALFAVEPAGVAAPRRARRAV